ncbi:hypothetical protein ACFRIB_46065, partial [Streptomyces mirabilis]|uniref:hypothetical protein n=1 Tax=Streptomyces mirabilis TaxID=68239 RepID=UPI0036946BB1
TGCRPTLNPPAKNALDDAGPALTSWHCFNRMIGQLYHCLRHRKLFDEHTAFPTELAAAA